MRKLFERFASDVGGATAIEYALIAALVAVAIVGSLGTLSDAVGELFTTVADALGN